MKYSIRTIAALSAAPIVAIIAAVLAHAVRIPPFAVRDDSMGLAACLAAFVGAGLLVQWRDKK
jgi:hypothetical protein